MLPLQPEGAALSVRSHGVNAELWGAGFLVDIRRWANGHSEGIMTGVISGGGFKIVLGGPGSLLNLVDAIMIL